MDASRSATIYTRDDMSAQQFFCYINIYVRLHVSTIQVIIIRSLIEINISCIYRSTPWCIHTNLHMDSWGIAPLIINLDSRGRWVVNFKPCLFASGKRSPIPTEWQAGWNLGPIRKFFREDKIFETRTVQPVAYSLFLLHYGSSVFFLFRYNFFLFIFESECVST